MLQSNRRAWPEALSKDPDGCCDDAFARCLSLGCLKAHYIEAPSIPRIYRQVRPPSMPSASRCTDNIRGIHKNRRLSMVSSHVPSPDRKTQIISRVS